MKELLNFILSLFSSKNTVVTEAIPMTTPKQPIITLEAFLMGRDKQYPVEYTKELQSNAMAFLERLNAFLEEIGIEHAEVSSGWRPAAINANVANAAKKSLHMTCKACDLKDLDGKLDILFATRPDLLRKYGLFLESPEHTSSWTHLDCGQRADRPSRIFIP